MDIKTNLNTVWYQNAKGDGRIKANYLKTKIAIPESLGGSGEGANPKELLVSSAATCYITTLVYILQTKKLPVAGLIMNSEATNSKQEGFKIIHYPHVILSIDATEDQIELAHEAIVAADKGCAIGNLLKKAEVEIEFEGKVSLVSDKDVVSQYVEDHGLDWF
ncbi:OsmC family protein [Paenibacillus sp. J5C_2022]|uniref:OsmC family protein n=1 Tax=Paenibacillus sp. J5C2022 TaxID=2977129 RepID=UPI0021CDF38B|nr:OsmC family protein [Paenibacillus sp. J5C2022]MCU6711537.1 OsmC family protein [Paenibacillus sp. J5C2022]